ILRAQDGPALKDVYGDAFLIGTAVNDPIVYGRDAAGQQLTLYHFNTITPENVMKAEEINPEPGVYVFGPADALVEFAEANDLFIVGHTLVWHNQTPAWFFTNEEGEPNTPEQQIER